MGDSNRIFCRNLAPWEVGFQRKTAMGDVSIQPNSKIYLDEEEIKAQVYSNNVLFCGTDGKGSHARIYIESPEIRKELGFDGDDGKTPQCVLDDTLLQKIFDYKRQSDFEKAVREHVTEHFEKFILVDFVKRTKVNDYNKIRFIAGYLGISTDRLFG